MSFYVVSNNHVRIPQQWRNSRGGGGRGQSASSYFSPGIEARKKGKWKRKEGKSKKGRWKIENGKGKSCKMKWGLPLFSAFAFAFHFSKPLAFVLGLPKWEFSTGKVFHAGKKSEKMTCSLLKSIPLAPLFLGLNISSLKVLGQYTVLHKYNTGVFLVG